MESYHNIWQKVRTIWKYIYTHYVQEYDYFLLSGDDTYVIIENLLDYLNSSTIRSEVARGKGVYLGRVFKATSTHNNQVFNSGGPGYILDTQAVRVLWENINLPHCNPGHIRNSYEDVNIAMCLSGGEYGTSGAIEVGEVVVGTGSDEGKIVAYRERAIPASTTTSTSTGTTTTTTPILPFDTRDTPYYEQLFHPFPPGTHWLYRPSTPAPSLAEDWFFHYDLHSKTGFNCCSRHSISFHYISPTLMQAIHDYLYYCPEDQKDEYFRTFGYEYYETSFTLQFHHTTSSTDNSSCSNINIQ